MITNELERMLAEFVALKYEALGHTVTNSGLDAYEVTFVGGAIAGHTLSIRCGETTESQALPKLVISCVEGDEDFDTGNQFIETSLTLTYPVDATTSITDQFERLNTETDRIRDWLVVDDIATAVPAVVTTSFNVLLIGLSGRGTRSDYDGHMRTHQLTLRLYCAGLETA